MPYLPSYTNLISWEKLIYYNIFCFIWQKGGKWISERGLVCPRTMCSSQLILGFTAISTHRLHQLLKERRFFTGSMLDLLSSKSNNFSFRHGQLATAA